MLFCQQVSGQDSTCPEFLNDLNSPSTSGTFYHLSYQMDCHKHLERHYCCYFYDIKAKVIGEGRETRLRYQGPHPHPISQPLDIWDINILAAS